MYESDYHGKENDGGDDYEEDYEVEDSISDRSRSPSPPPPPPPLQEQSFIDQGSVIKHQQDSASNGQNVFQNNAYDDSGSGSNKGRVGPFPFLRKNR